MPRKTAAAKRNTKPRKRLAETGVLTWQLAEALHMSASNLYVLLRTEQPEEIQQHWIEVIDEIAAKNAVN